MTADDMAVVLFPNTQAAIRAEQIFLAEGIRGKLIPVPRQFGSECGLAFRFASGDRARVQEALGRAGVTYKDIRELQAGAEDVKRET